jgi:riboflavin kinase/FMN adenylyltransferase
MRIFRKLSPLPPDARGAVLAIGNFDGVHLGHRAVIGEACRLAAERGTPSGVLTFEPHPRRFFRPAQPPFLLTRLRTRIRLFAAIGIDVVHLLRFDRVFAALSADQFIDTVLLDALDVRHVVVGYDFVFGRGRHGTASVLEAQLGARGVGISVMSPVAPSEAEGAPVYSSTAARQALADGEPETAARILGRPFTIEGRVRQGDRRGRTIGFPTANIFLDGYVTPRLGVYAVQLEVGGERYGGVANLGLRPTFGGDKAPRLEVHLFDFSADLYGRLVQVELLRFLRPEQRFDGIDALKAQIARDAEVARAAMALYCRTAARSL